MLRFAARAASLFALLFAVMGGSMIMLGLAATGVPVWLLATSSQWGEKRREEREARRDALTLAAEMRALRRTVSPDLAPKACAHLRASIAELWESICESREERAKLANGDAEPLYFWSGDKRLAAAFNDGAGAEVLA